MGAPTVCLVYLNQKNCIVLKQSHFHDTNIDTCFTQMRMNGKTLIMTNFCRNKHHQTTTLNPQTYLSTTLLASWGLTKKPSTRGTNTSSISETTIICGWARLPYDQIISTWASKILVLLTSLIYLSSFTRNWYTCYFPNQSAQVQLESTGLPMPSTVGLGNYLDLDCRKLNLK